MHLKLETEIYHTQQGVKVESVLFFLLPCLSGIFDIASIHRLVEVHLGDRGTSDHNLVEHDANYP